MKKISRYYWKFSNIYHFNPNCSENNLNYLTAPNVKPLTKCFCANQPTIRIGTTVIVEAADNLAQNKPWLFAKEAIKAVNGAEFAADKLILQNDSFQQKINDNNDVETTPG